MEATLVSHTGDIIHAFFHDCRGIRTRTDAATSPSIAKCGASTDGATETSIVLQSTPPCEVSVAQSVEAPYFAMLGDVAESVRFRIPRQTYYFSSVSVDEWPPFGK